SLLRSFTFAQQGTNVSALLETVAPIFADTKLVVNSHGSGGGGAGGGAAGRVTQFLIILSDGRITDARARLAAAIQRLEDAAVMICFIVLDATDDDVVDPAAPPTVSLFGAGPAGAAAGARPLIGPPAGSAGG